MQSRFILMEGAPVSLALLLMAAALGMSAAIRSQFSSGIQALHQQIVLHTQLHDVFDSCVLNFWRSYGSNNAGLLAEYRSSDRKLRALTKQSADFAPSEVQRDEVAELAAHEEDFFDLTDHLLAGQQIEAAAEPQFDDVAKRELRVRNAQLGPGNARAHGNLDVKGEVPKNVELGSLTAAFLTMASELRDMRDSLEEKVRQRAAQLEAAHNDLLRAAKLASLGQLVSGVAHEINNPLTSILGFTEVVLGRPVLEPAVRTQLQTVRDEALRLKSLLGNLSRMSRRHPEQLHRMDLRTVPVRMLELRSYQLAANNIRVQYTPARAPIFVKGDVELLLQAMLQLVLNAEQSIRESRQKGEIQLKCDVWDGRARITVADNGCGIPPEIREHIFGPFFTSRPMWQGTGLGLSICHSIVEQHDGEIGVESEVGRGTNIRVLLPLASMEDSNAEHAGSDLPALEPIESAEAREEPALPSPACRFLVIDDEIEILNLVSVVLAKMGAAVVILQDPTRLDSILNSTHNGKFDAVLCDLKMPGQDGLAVLRILRQRQPELARRFLLMTGNLADADKAQIELEGVRILPKPFTLVSLRAMVGEIVSSNS